MTTQEANKIIAEFMGFKVKLYETLKGADIPLNFGKYWKQIEGSHAPYDQWEPVEYIYSLDALVPVWGKLGWFNKTVVMRNNDLTDNKCSYEIAVKKGFFDAQAENYQKAAAIATAKAILGGIPTEGRHCLSCHLSHKNCKCDKVDPNK